MYSLSVMPYVDKKFSKMVGRENTALEAIENKVNEIRSNPQHKYKFLKSPLQGYNRVHIIGNFVLVFKIVHDKKMVELWEYDTHDNIYRSKRL